MIGQPVLFVLGNSVIVLFAIAVATTIAKLRRFRREHRPVSSAYVFWGELLFYNVGVGFVLVGIFHAYFLQIAAPSIGWSSSSFEYEVGSRSRRRPTYKRFRAVATTLPARPA